jgi:hypothetical protein
VVEVDDDDNDDETVNANIYTHNNAAIKWLTSGKEGQIKYCSTFPSLIRFIKFVVLLW